MSDDQTTPIVRVCRKCSAQSSVPGDFCPHCGTPYVKQGRRPSKRTTVVLIVAAVLLLGGAAAVVVKMQMDANAQEEREAVAAERVAEEEAEAAAAQEESDEQERESRREMVNELEKNITKSAKKAARTGVLDGPIKYSSCTATGGGSTDDLTALTGTFDCMAVNKENKDDTVSGYGYDGTIDWQSGELTWQLSP